MLAQFKNATKCFCYYGSSEICEISLFMLFAGCVVLLGHNSFTRPWAQLWQTRQRSLYRQWSYIRQRSVCWPFGLRLSTLELTGNSSVFWTSLHLPDVVVCSNYASSLHPADCLQALVLFRDVSIGNVNHGPLGYLISGCVVDVNVKKSDISLQFINQLSLSHEQNLPKDSLKPNTDICTGERLWTLTMQHAVSLFHDKVIPSLCKWKQKTSFLLLPPSPPEKSNPT